MKSSDLRLVLTGEIDRNGRYVSIVAGNPVRHTYTQFVALCRLVLARWTTRQGRLPRTVFCVSRGNAYRIVLRLRREFADVLGTGTDVVLALGNGTYRLDIDAAGIALRSDFSELASDLPERLFRSLVKACPQWVEPDEAVSVEESNDSAVSIECQRL